MLKRVITLLVAAGLGVVASAAVTVKRAQTITLKKGWNAVYIQVAPDEAADDLFADWPVDTVGFYDPAAFLDTVQYSGTESTEGTLRTGFVLWRRNEPGLSALRYVAANGVYVCYASAAFTTTLYGRPAAPRITWHVTSDDTVLNYVGLAVEPGETARLYDYFDGFDGGKTALQSIFILTGTDASSGGSGQVLSQTGLENGTGLLMSSQKVSDWSGVLNVSPISGLDFSTDKSVRTLTVRNDGSYARTVSVSLTPGDGTTGVIVPPMPEHLYVRDAAFRTNAWTSFSTETPFSKKLAAGEKLELEIAVDRSAYTSAAGTYYGALVHVRDTDGGSKMHVALPLDVTSDGGVAAENAWPKGLWLANGEFDAVSFIQRSNEDAAWNNDAVKAAGSFKVRLPFYVSRDGSMALLSRFVFGADSNGVTHVYSAKKENAFPVPLANAKRVSSAVLPIDAVDGRIDAWRSPVYETRIVVSTNWLDEAHTNFWTKTETNVVQTGTEAYGSFGDKAAFAFTVSENSPVNPFRHPFHPQHDGLQWDFQTPTPSGDDVKNYVSTVKPEIFSVSNRIEFTWNASSGTKWTPEEKLSGVLTWTLEGVRKEAPVVMKGRFTMKRISDAELDR